MMSFTPELVATVLDYNNYNWFIWQGESFMLTHESRGFSMSANTVFGLPKDERGKIVAISSFGLHALCDMDIRLTRKFSRQELTGYEEAKEAYIKRSLTGHPR